MCSPAALGANVLAVSRYPPHTPRRGRHHDRQRSPDRRQPPECTPSRAEDPGGQGALAGQRAQAWPLLLGVVPEDAQLVQARAGRLLQDAPAPEPLPLLAGHPDRRCSASASTAASGSSGGSATRSPSGPNSPGTTTAGWRRAGLGGQLGDRPEEVGRAAPPDAPGVRVADGPVGDAGPLGRRQGGVDPGPGPAGVRPARHPGRVPRRPPPGGLDRLRRPGGRAGRRPGRRRPPRDRRPAGAPRPGRGARRGQPVAGRGRPGRRRPTPS